MHRELGISERRACRLQGLARATQRRTDRLGSEEIRLMARITELATRYGRHGYRRITAPLQKEKKKGVSAAALVAAKQVTDILVEADRLLAVALINDASSATVVNPQHQKRVDREVACAIEALAKGDAARGTGHFNKAIDWYREAWEHAGHALEEMGKWPRCTTRQSARPIQRSKIAQTMLPSSFSP